MSVAAARYRPRPREIVEVDNTSHQIQHDYSGAVTQAVDLSLSYGPLGRLLEATDANGTQNYAYDAQGRLAAVFDGGALTKSFAYDGHQIISAFDPTGLALWEAMWGPYTDQLIEWYDVSLDRAYVSCSTATKRRPVPVRTPPMSTARSRTNFRPGFRLGLPVRCIRPRPAWCICATAGTRPGSSNF